MYKNMNDFNCICMSAVVTDIYFWHVYI